MSDLNFNASAGIDISTPFCPRTYFHGLREAGVRPSARSFNGKRFFGQSCDDPAANRNASPWYAWACRQDHDQKQVSAYVSAILDKHHCPKDHLLVLDLGINDDEMEPEIVAKA
ncbi:hypothetical protein [Bradyrhizobium diversitatis]|uniref:Uncharacterized protein n=1 Tax=Bradyrhizobium diversitatis TaxID=2755406 RepID=A0ABS0P1A3_9BRAD|nr:hypothetical protein [Bradyrhizobium diversitatis]MBH5387036.1 hypothetical protein [Bradyrhizobium diversitatis]